MIMKESSSLISEPFWLAKSSAVPGAAAPRFTLGVRLDIDFDAFFERQRDAEWQLARWRDIIAGDVLHVPSSSLLLHRVARGSLDLEFVVTVDSGMSDAELDTRAREGARRLGELLRQPVVHVRMGPEGEAEDIFGTPAALPTTTPVPMLNSLECGPSRMSSVERARSHSPGPSRVRAHSPGPTYGRALARPYVRPERLNHPTTTVGPSFLMDDGYWQARKGSRICERKESVDRLRREQEEAPPPPFRHRPMPASVSAPRFQAMQAEAELRRSRSAEARAAPSGALPSSALQSGALPSGALAARAPRRSLDIEPRASSESPRPFRAKPVPWRVSAPLYDQMLLEQNRSRQERLGAQSRASMRASSLPPRLEAVRARLCGEAPGRGRANRASTPVPPSQLARGTPPETQMLNRPLHAELPRGVPGGPGSTVLTHAAESLARDVAATAAGAPPGTGYGTASIYGSSYGVSHLARHKTPPRTRAASQPEQPLARQFATKEVPDFAALHERERQKMERRKYQNRFVTQPEPFSFRAPSRSATRQPALPKDPSRDWRWEQRRQRRPQSARRASPATGGRFSVPTLERPSVAVPPRTTEKTLRAQQHTARVLQERREQEWRQQQELEQSRAIPSELRARVQRAVGPVEPIEEVCQRKVAEKRSSFWRTHQTKQRDLHQMHERVNRRPLLMEQTDSLARARRRALFRVRSTLEAAGVPNVDAHFRDDELDEIDRIGADGAPYDPGDGA